MAKTNRKSAPKQKPRLHQFRGDPAPENSPYLVELKRLRETYGPPNNIGHYIAVVREHAAARLAAFGAAEWPHSLPFERPPNVSEGDWQQARQLVCALVDLRGVEMALEEGDAAKAALRSFKAGVMYGRSTMVRAAEKSWRKARAAREAGKSREPITAPQQEEAIREIDALMQTERLPLQTACKQLVAKYGVNYRTLKRYYERERRP